MARIESIAKAGYYPTPPRVTELICNRIRHFARHRMPSKGIRILDPCCGQGEAAAAAAQRASQLGLEPSTYGVELNYQRAKAARANLDNVLSCDFFQTTIAHGSFDILWLNPPYDLEVAGSPSRRTETAYLKRCIPYLKKSSGILILIIPRKSLPDCASTLSREFHNLHCLAFPPPEADRFDQLVITGTRKNEPAPDPAVTQTLTKLAWGLQEPTSIASPPNNWELTLPREGHLPSEILFANHRINTAQALAEAASRGIFSNPSTKERFWPTRQLTSRPILPLRQGHIAIMTAAGFLDNQVLTSIEEQDSLIIKGRTYKESAITAETQTSRTETEFVSTTIRCLNLSTGERRDIKP